MTRATWLLVALVAGTMPVSAFPAGVVGATTAPDPIGILKEFFARYCSTNTTDCVSSCDMISGSFQAASPFPPYPVVNTNASQCRAGCKAASPASFCNAAFLDSHCNSLGNTGSATFVWQEGTTPNASAPQCTFGLNIAMYVEVDTDGKLKVAREFFNPAEYADRLSYCSSDLGVGAGGASRAVFPQRTATTGAAELASTQSALSLYPSDKKTATAHLDKGELVSAIPTPPSTAVAGVDQVVDDTNATSLCLGMLAQYSRRRCDQLAHFVAPGIFRFEFSGGPDGGVDLEYLTHNCDAPKPPEWITVQESFVENTTFGDFWDFYATSSTNPKTGRPCATILPESYRCTAVQTPAGLRLSYVHDTFDPAVFAAWAASCGLPEKLHVRWAM